MDRCENCGAALDGTDTAALDSFEDGEPYEILLATTDQWELLTDSAGDGLMKVRQLAMVVEPKINLNNRYIPRDVAIPALQEAQRRARAGAESERQRRDSGSAAACRHVLLRPRISRHYAAGPPLA